MGKHRRGREVSLPRCKVQILAASPYSSDAESMNFLKALPVGDNPPDIVNVVIEVSSGSRDKYEFNDEWEVFVLDRVIPSSVVFPIEYGFVPRTLAHDGDPLDAMVMSYEHLEIGCVVKARVIGALMGSDERGEDAKILTVLVNDARFDGWTNISDVHRHKLREIQEFFDTYKRLEQPKWSTFGEWKGAQQAKKIVNDAMAHYDQANSGQVSKASVLHDLASVVGEDGGQTADSSPQAP
jgi:inorganic pyrophosphatase